MAEGTWLRVSGPESECFKLVFSEKRQHASSQSYVPLPQIPVLRLYAILGPPIALFMLIERWI